MKVVTIQTGKINTNTYIVYYEGCKQCLLIDTGDDSDKIIKQLNVLNLTPIAILLTHGHFDHCGACAKLVETYAIPVYANINDCELASNASKNRWNIPVDDCYVSQVFDKENHICIAEFGIDIVHTPGHTEGSVCYIIDKFMFSGDTLFHGDVGRTDLPNSNPKHMQESLIKLNNIEIDYTVLPGHEEATTLYEEKKYNIYLSRAGK